MHIMAIGLQFPEGPIAMPDGSVILVGIARETLSHEGKLGVMQWREPGLRLNFQP